MRSNPPGNRDDHDDHGPGLTVDPLAFAWWLAVQKLARTVQSLLRGLLRLRDRTTDPNT